MAKEYISVEDLQKFCDNSVTHTISPNDFHRMNTEIMPEYTADDYRRALQTVAGMQVTDQVHYLGVEDIIRSSMEGLVLVVLNDNCKVPKVINAVQMYKDDKRKAKLDEQKMEVKRLADKIGKHNLLMFVHELLKEGYMDGTEALRMDLHAEDEEHDDH